MEWKLAKMKKRIPEVNAIAKEMKEASFLNKCELGDCDIDFSKFIMSGQSMGGWTTLEACLDSTNEAGFAGCVAMDPSHLQNSKELADGTYKVTKIPCQIFQSQTYLSFMARNQFGTTNSL